jgi:SGNH hydrolase-like domain, acetyltransferase AlgX
MMIKYVKWLVGIVFLAWVFLPLCTQPWSVKANRIQLEKVENRRPAPWPEIHSFETLLQLDTYKKVNAALDDRMAWRYWMNWLWCNIEYVVFFQRTFGTVDIGEQGWYYSRDSYYYPSETEEMVERVLDRLSKFVKERESDKSELLIVFAPDKQTIYPEYLSRTCMYYKRKGNRRWEMTQAFCDEQAPEAILNLWPFYKDEKEKQQTLLYYKKDTHHTPIGALIMVREILNRIAPGIWDATEIVDMGKKKNIGNLTLMSGLGNTAEYHRKVDVLRPGVELVQKNWLKKTRSWKDPIRFYSRSETRRMIEGKTLIIHDSMVIHSRETLRQFFENITFIHYHEISSLGGLARVMNEYDRVVVECAERRMFNTWDNLLDTSDYSVLSTYDKEDLESIWNNEHVLLSWEEEALTIQITGNDPSLYMPIKPVFCNTEYILQIDLESPVDTSCQLFYLNNASEYFHEQRSIIKEVYVGRRFVTFLLPPDSIFKKKRFDLNTMDGVFVIHSMRLLQSKNAKEDSQEALYALPSSALSYFQDEITGAFQYSVPAELEASLDLQMHPISAGIWLESQNADPQIIIPGIPGALSSSQPVVEINLGVEKGTQCQLFYQIQADQGFVESRSVHEAVAPGETLVRFELKADQVRNALRLDPGTYAGQYLIRSICIKGINLSSQEERLAGNADIDNPKQCKVHVVYPTTLLEIKTGKQFKRYIKKSRDVDLQIEGQDLVMTTDTTDSNIIIQKSLDSKHGMLKWEVVLDASCATTAQVYYLNDEDGEYNETASIRQDVAQGENVLTFILEDWHLYYPLRFDFACDPGTYTIKSIRLSEVVDLHKKWQGRRK